MNRVEVLDVTCPPGTPADAPLETDFPFPPGQVKRVEVRIFPGHACLTGISLAQAHQATVPYTAGAFLIGDDDHLAYDLDDELANGAWSVFTYNTDRHYPHSWQVRWLVLDATSRPRRRRHAPISPATIHDVAGLRLPAPGTAELPGPPPEHRERVRFTAPRVQALIPGPSEGDHPGDHPREATAAPQAGSGVTA